MCKILRAFPDIISAVRDVKPQINKSNKERKRRRTQTPKPLCLVVVMCKSLLLNIKKPVVVVKCDILSLANASVIVGSNPIHERKNM